MNLSIIKKFGLEGNIIKDCQFDSFGLIGKKCVSDQKVLTFLNDVAYVNQFLESRVAGVICTEEIANTIKDKYTGGICATEEPKPLFFQFHNKLVDEGKLYKKMGNSWISPFAKIHPTAIIAEKDVIINDYVEIGARSVIHEGVRIKNKAIIREGCIIGSPAFYYFKMGKDNILVKSVGRVIIEEAVEMHPYVIIEKGVLSGFTIIGKHCVIGSGSVIEHNSNIGDNCIVCAGVKIAGGIEIAEDTFIGVSASIAPNIKIGSDAKASIGAVITKDVGDETQVSGNFAIEHNKFVNFIKTIK